GAGGRRGGGAGAHRALDRGGSTQGRRTMSERDPEGRSADPAEEAREGEARRAEPAGPVAEDNPERDGREGWLAKRAASGTPVLVPPAPSGVTEDERFLESTKDRLLGDPLFAVGKDAWRVFRIMGEFVEGFDTLTGKGPCVSIFGSARVTRD